MNRASSFGIGVLGLAIILSFSAQVAQAEGRSVTVFQAPPNASEVLEALGEKPKIKYRGVTTRSIKFNDEDAGSAPAAEEPVAKAAPPQAVVKATPAPEPQQAAPAEEPEEQEPAQVAETKKTTKKVAKAKSSGGKASVAFPLYFATNSAVLNDEAKNFADSMGQALKQKPDMTLVISGHTDPRGGEKINKPLSLERAEAVKNYLVEKYEIDPERLSVVGAGSSQLLVKNNPTATENRRVEFSKRE